MVRQPTARPGDFSVNLEDTQNVAPRMTRMLLKKSVSARIQATVRARVCPGGFPVPGKGKGDRRSSGPSGEQLGSGAGVGQRLWAGLSGRGLVQAPG